MQSPPLNTGVASSVHLCGSIKQIIEDYVSSNRLTSEADIEPFRLEVQTLHKYLDLFEKVRNAREPRLDFEQTHLRDVNHLLCRCQRTLSTLHSTLKRAGQTDADTNDQGKPWDLNASTFTIPRFYISFYTRTLEMTLMGIHLLHHWKGQLPTNSADFGREDFSVVTHALTSTVSQRRELTGGGHHEECVEEMGLLRDVEQCVRSAEVFISLAVPETSYAQSQPSSRYDASQPPQQQPNGIQNGVQHWVADLALRNGSRTSSSPPYSKTEDHASDDSDVESIDQEIDHEVGFSVEVYAKMLATLMRELRDKMDHRNYHEAEAICKIVMKHSIERETNLGIPFDDRSELEEILAETCLEQERYQKAKTILRPLLRHGSIDPDHRSRLHLLLARAHAGRNQLNKAETLAQAALRTREDEHGKEHHTTQETALFLISIYEQQGEQATANALRMIYCPHFISPPPPRSALRHPPQQQSHQRQTSSQPQPTADLTPPHPQSPSEYEDDGFHPKESHVHWAPDVVTSDSSINALSDSGQTLLIHGIRQRDDLYVKLTVDRGASVDKPCADTITPLMHAVIVESESIVEFLLDKGADMEIPTSGWTPLHKATQLRNLAIMELLLDAGADIEAKGPLEFIQPRSEAARMKALARDEPDLERDIRCRENLKWTPLLRAAFNGEEAATRLLLDHGANIEARNPKKATPLMCACENLHTAVAGLLLERGAKVHAVDEYGWTPLHRTLVNPGAEQHKIITLLLSHSADINAKCSNGCTPLHYAVKRNEPAIVTCLLAHRADIEARDSADLTPLHTAINCRLEPMVRLLLERGADASAKNGDEDDALAAARHADRQSPEIIGLLRKHQKITKENLDAIRGNFGRSRRVSTISSGTGAADAVAEPSKKPEKKGLFGRKLSKEK